MTNQRTDLITDYTTSANSLILTATDIDVEFEFGSKELLNWAMGHLAAMKQLHGPARTIGEVEDRLAGYVSFGIIL